MGLECVKGKVQCIQVHNVDVHLQGWRRSEQLVWADGRQRLPPVAEGAVLGHGEGLVLLLAQQREHVLHQLTQPAVSAERRKGHTGRRRIEIMKGSTMFFFFCYERDASNYRVSKSSRLGCFFCPENNLTMQRSRHRNFSSDCEQRMFFK